MADELIITNPATGDEVARVGADTPATIADKLKRARRAQPAWAAQPLAERLAALARFRDSLRRDSDDLARTLVREMGKPIVQARAEIAATQGRIDFFLSSTEAVLVDEAVHDEPDGALSERITWDPLGVVANVGVELSLLCRRQRLRSGPAPGNAVCTAVRVRDAHRSGDRGPPARPACRQT
jgi:succinylglutamic semialdehyde dehydrogenase